MTSLAFGLGGAAIGSAFGQAGLGMAAGSIAYSLLYSQKQEDIVNEGPRVNKQLGTTSAFGIMRPIVYGTFPCPANIIDASEKREIRHVEKQKDSGGKNFINSGGPTVKTVWYTAAIDIALGLGEGPRDGILILYANEDVLIDNRVGSTITSPPWLKYRFYKGTSDQEPDPTLEQLHGVGETPAYRDECYLMLVDFQLERFNNNVPSFRAVTMTGSTGQPSYTQHFFGNSSNNGSLISDPRRSWLFHVVNPTTTGKICDVYDMVSQKKIFSLQEPPDISELDSGGGSNLLSLPLLGDVEVPDMPNGHIVINTTPSGGGTALSIFNTTTGEFLATVGVPTVGSDANKKVFVANDNSSRFYYTTTENFRSKLRCFRIRRTIIPVDGKTIFIEEVYDVLLPIPNRDGINEWSWFLDSISYPFGTNRQGSFVIYGRDDVDTKDYMCVIKDNSNVVHAFVEVTGLYASIDYCVYDSVQQIYWVLGTSPTSTTHIRAVAIDGDANIIYNLDIDNSSFRSFSDLCVFVAETSSLIWFDTGNKKFRQFNTVTHTITLIDDQVYPDGGAMAQYNHMTRTYFKTGTAINILDMCNLSRITSNGISLSDVITNLCERAGIPVSKYNTTELGTKIVSGYGIFSDGNIRSKIIPLQSAYLFDGVDKGKIIDFEFRAKAPVATLTIDDLGVIQAGNEPFVKIDNAQDLELPGRTEITYYSDDLEWEQNTQVAFRGASAVVENPAVMSLPIVLNDDEAIQLADITEHLAHIERETYEINAMPKWQYLCGGDIIEFYPFLFDKNKKLTGRILKRTFTGTHVNIVLSREETSILTSSIVGATQSARQFSVPYNPLTFALPLDAPLFYESHNNAGFPVAVCGYENSWAGGNLYRSFDKGSTWNLLETIVDVTIIGNVRTLLGDARCTVIDIRNTFNVNLLQGEISSAPIDDVLARGEINHCLIGNNGRWEVVAYVNAILQGDGSFTCDTLFRGLLGTEWAAALHQSGDFFIGLSAADMTYIQDSLNNINAPYAMRAVSLGQNVFGNQVLDLYHVNTGVCLRPVRPARVYTVKNYTSLDLQIQWEQSTRFRRDQFWMLVPSEAELYTVEIINNETGNVVRTVNDLTTSEYLYTRADQITDGAPSNSRIIITINIYARNTALPANDDKGKPGTTEAQIGPSLGPTSTYILSLEPIALWECDDADQPLIDIANGWSQEVRNESNNFFYQTASLLPSGYGASFEVKDSGYTRNLDDWPTSIFNQFDFSISTLIAWQEANSRGLQYPFSIRDTSGYRMRFAWLANNNIGLYFRNVNGNVWTLDSGITAVVGQTYMLVGTVKTDGHNIFGPLNLYVDGQLKATTQVNMANNTRDHRQQSGYSPAVNRNRQQLRAVYDRALTASEADILFKTTGL